MGAAELRTALSDARSLAAAGSPAPEAVRAAMIYGSVMASFAVEAFSLDGLRDLARAARIG